MDVDALLREVLDGRAPTDAELSEIVEHIAKADFLHEGSMRLHLQKRIRDLQWTADATVEDYRQDLARMAQGATQLAVYRRRGGAMAALFSLTIAVIPRERLGSRAEDQCILVYSIDRGRLVTGYQFSTPSQLALPEDMKWLQLTRLP